MPLLVATLLAAAGEVEKNYREHKRTYKQKKQTEKVITEPTLSVFQCNSRWECTNKGNCKYTTYLIRTSPSIVNMSNLSSS